MRYLKCFKSHEYVENKFKKEKRKHINLKKETSIRKGNGDCLKRSLATHRSRTGHHRPNTLLKSTYIVPHTRLSKPMSSVL